MGARCSRNSDPDEEAEAHDFGTRPNEPIHSELVIIRQQQLLDPISCLRCNRCLRETNALEFEHQQVDELPGISSEVLRMDVEDPQQIGRSPPLRRPLCGTCTQPSATAWWSRPSPAQVTLHIYDVGNTCQVNTINRLLRPLGAGVFHCGVEVFDSEWSYSDTRAGVGTGIFCCQPRLCKGHHYCESINMGKTSVRELEVLDLVATLETAWPVTAYHVLTHNCCHFCNELCQRLGVGSIPAWVMNLASAGAALVSSSEGSCCMQAAHLCGISEKGKAEVTSTSVQIMEK